MHSRYHNVIDEYTWISKNYTPKGKLLYVKPPEDTDLGQMTPLSFGLQSGNACRSPQFDIEFQQLQARV
jgi:hypothetical protein